MPDPLDSQHVHEATALRTNGAHQSAESHMQLAIPVNPAKVARILATIAVCLALLSLAADHIEYAAGEQNMTPLLENVLWVFGMNHEQSLPAWYSASLLLGCAGLLATIAFARRAGPDRYSRHWAGLAIIFTYLSLDEAAALHEILTEPLQDTLSPIGVLYFAWVIVFVPLVLIFALAYLRFLLHLPPRIRNLFAAAGAIYVGGAVFVEGISANQWYLNDGSTPLYSAIGTVEELFEMLGAIVFMYALLSHFQRVQVGLNLQGDIQAAANVPWLAGIRTKLENNRSALSRAALSPTLIVFFGGVNLILIQWVLVRELTTLLLGTELVVLLVGVAYFAGLSVGYLLSGRIPRGWLPLLAVATLILHLTLPIWFRLLVAWFGAADVYWAAYLALPVLTPFVVSAFYSVFLPLFVDGGQGQLPNLYALEVLGAGAGVLVLVALGGLGLQTVLVVYSLGLLLILWALGMRRHIVATLSLVAALWLAALPGVNYWSNSLWYEKLLDFPEGTTTLFSGYSPYQKVDVLETPSGRRYLMLDGLEHFDTANGQWINIILGQIPAALTQPENALVVGAGTMQTEQMIAQFGGHVTTVEIDPLVVEAGRDYFLPYNRMDVLTNRTVVVDDAKHFIANSGDTYDLIATDTPAAFSLQTATLYSQPFYQAIHRRLTPDGVLAANLTSPFGPNDLVSRRIVAGLLMTFDDVVVVTSDSVGWSFAYASDNLPFDTLAVETALRQNGELRYVIFDTPAVRGMVGDAQPITLDSLDIVLHVSADWIGERLR
jgi:spermidine synthase